MKNSCSVYSVSNTGLISIIWAFYRGISLGAVAAGDGDWGSSRGSRQPLILLLGLPVLWFVVLRDCHG